MLPPNKPTRPAGMPPLVPLEAEIVHQTLRSRSSIIREQQQALIGNPNLMIEVDATDDRNRNINVNRSKQTQNNRNHNNKGHIHDNR